MPVKYHEHDEKTFLLFVSHEINLSNKSMAIKRHIVTAEKLLNLLGLSRLQSKFTI